MSPVCLLGLDGKPRGEVSHSALIRGGCVTLLHAEEAQVLLFETSWETAEMPQGPWRGVRFRLLGHTGADPGSRC